jgi:hypothetical protein
VGRQGEGGRRGSWDCNGWRYGLALALGLISLLSLSLRSVSALIQCSATCHLCHSPTVLSSLFLSSSLLLVFLPLLNVRVCSSAHTCHYRARWGTITPPTLPGHVTSSDRQLHTRAVDVMNALPVHERDLAGANAVGLQGLWFDDQKLPESPHQISRFQFQFSSHYPSPFGMRRIIRFWVERQRRGPVHVQSLSTMEVSPLWPSSSPPVTP